MIILHRVQRPEVLALEHLLRLMSARVDSVGGTRIATLPARRILPSMRDFNDANLSVVNKPI
jgi:hypothetical protein